MNDQVSTPAPAEEALVAEWQEPALTEDTRTFFSPPIVYGVGGTIAVFLIAIGFWQKDWTFYLAAFTSLAASFMIVVQRKPHPPLEIVLSTQRLQVGKKIFSLVELAGFWLEKTDAGIMINVEPAKRSLFPISFLAPTDSEGDVKEVLLQVLAEVEPREKNTTEGLNKYFRL